VAAVRFIKRAQKHGFNLDEIEELLHLAGGGPDDCEAARQLAQLKMAHLADRMADLERMRGSLAELIASCDLDPTDRYCPMIQPCMPREKPMKLEILQLPNCPNVALLERRIAEAVAVKHIDVAIKRRVLTNRDAATAAGMTGSPTLLVDGEDPFAESGLVPSLSCRLYPADGGGVDGAPSVTALRAALNQCGYDLKLRT